MYVFILSGAPIHCGTIFISSHRPKHFPMNIISNVNIRKYCALKQLILLCAEMFVCFYHAHAHSCIKQKFAHLHNNISWWLPNMVQNYIENIPILKSLPKHTSIYSWIIRWLSGRTVFGYWLKKRENDKKYTQNLF